MNGARYSLVAEPDSVAVTVVCSHDPEPLHGTIVDLIDMGVLHGAARAIVAPCARGDCDWDYCQEWEEPSTASLVIRHAWADAILDSYGPAADIEAVRDELTDVLGERLSGGGR